MRTFNELPEKSFNPGIPNDIPEFIVRIPGNRASTAMGLLALRMLEAIVVRRMGHATMTQNRTNRITFPDPIEGYFQSGYFFFTRSLRMLISSSFSPSSFTASLYFFSIS